MTIESAVDYLFLGMGGALVYLLASWLGGLIHAKRDKRILEIDLALKKIDDADSRLSVDELITKSNADKPGDTNDPSQKG